MPRKSKRLVLSLNRSDTGGQGYRLKEAFDRHSKRFKFRNIIRGVNYLDYPVDLNSALEPVTYRKLLVEADLLHVHNFYDRAYTKFGTTPEPVPILMHQHGRQDRRNVRELDKKVNMYRVVSAIGIISYVGMDPERLLPTPIDVPKIKSMKKPKETDKIVIGQCPTNRSIKNTDLFIKCVRK